MKIQLTWKHCLPQVLMVHRILATTPIWHADLSFQEFAGLPGGFEPGTPIMQSAHSDTVVRNYDVLCPRGTDPATGWPVLDLGQDGVSDLTIRTMVVDGSNGRWASLHAGKRTGGYFGGATIGRSSSRSGDWGLVAIEFTFDPGVEVTADQFALSLTSANGTTEAYEWTMITLGGINDAPFSLSQIGDYSAADYSSLGSSTYYSSVGGLSGLPGTGQRLDTGRSISQFLTNSAPAPVSGGLIGPGWFAVDDFNAHVFDGPESEWDNPYAEAGTLDDNPLVTGQSLGLQPNLSLRRFTVWIGIHDIGFDSDGDGFTATDGNPFVSISGLSIGRTTGLPVPEARFVGVLALCWPLLRRRRN